MGAGHSKCQQTYQCEHCRRQPLNRAGGTVLHTKIILLSCFYDIILPPKRGEIV